MLLYAGELRLIAISFENDPGVVAGATVSEVQTVEFLEKRGEAVVADVIQDTTPAPPTVVTPEVRCWADVVGVTPARYIARATVTLSNGETAVAETAVVVE